MKLFFQDIFEYHHHFNQMLAGQLTENEAKITDRSIPLFSHIVNAHQIWNSRILQTASTGVNDVHILEKCISFDDSNYHDTLKILDEFDLDTRISYHNTKGDQYTNSIQQILFHVANHTTHHRGQIISDLRQRGIEPLVTDYIFYKR